MKKYLLPALAALSFLVASCAAPRQYVAPSVEPTRAGITASQNKVASAQKHVADAQGHVTKAQTNSTSIKELAEKIQGDKEATDNIRQLAAQLLKDNDALMQELTTTQEALRQSQLDQADAQTALAQSQANASTLQGKIEAQTKTLNTTAADLAVTKSAYHKLKFAVIALAMALTVFVVFSIAGVAAFAPPLLYVTIGAPVAIGFFLLLRI